ncbi:MAG: hypothetical protein HOO06_13290 [Bdellovibrionaceae bacterium]|jgi:hypothetical protein|nr:hypothetical protein [Pseudobdellovibrionaceae bacterium]
MKVFIKALIFTLFLIPSVSWAFYTHHDTGEILKVSQYKLGLGTQIITDPKTYSGTGFFGYLDSGLDDGANVRVNLGVGSEVFHTGVFYKWVPYPDYGEQPAMGIRIGASYSRYNGESEISLRAHPFVSKKFKTEFGDIDAYSALQLGIRGYKDSTTVPAQLSFGGELKTSYYDSTLFTGEIGVNMAKAFTYISIGIIFYVDDNKDYQLENPLKYLRKKNK